MNRIELFIIAFVITAASSAGAGDRVRTEKNSIGFSVQTISLPEDEPLTLGGTACRIYGGDVWYYGISAYGAVAGERGGFFTGGVCGGARVPIFDGWTAYAECFFGGGGGGAAPQGGGMMLRPSCMFFKKAGRVSVGAGYSYVWFPNGEISSGSVCGGLQVDFDRAYTEGRTFGQGQTDLDLKPVRWRYGPGICAYTVSGENRTLSGEEYDDTVICAGFGADRFVSQRLCFTGRIYGAFSGEADGYAKLLCGPVYSSPRFAQDRVRAEAGLLAGAAGGGGVDTGGGLLVQPEIGLVIHLSDSYSVYVREGYLHAFSGDFDCLTSSLGICRSFGGFSFSDNRREQVSYTLFPWRTGISVKTCFPGSGIRKKSGDPYERTISLIGITADRLLTPASYLCAAAYGAFEGKAGGYAEGFMGMGLVLFENGTVSAESDLRIGASGGGGVDIGGGMILEAGLSIEYRFDESYACMLRAGWLSAPGGTYEAPFAEAGISRSFGQLGNGQRI